MSATNSPLQRFRAQIVSRKTMQNGNHSAPSISCCDCSSSFTGTPQHRRTIPGTLSVFQRRLDRGNMVNKTGFAGMFTSRHRLVVTCRGVVGCGGCGHGCYMTTCSFSLAQPGCDCDSRKNLCLATSTVDLPSPTMQRRRCSPVLGINSPLPTADHYEPCWCNYLLLAIINHHQP